MSKSTYDWGGHIQSRSGVLIAQLIVSRALSCLFIKIAYGDALSQHAIDELIVANREAQRRTSEAFTHLWLVNFFPCRKSTSFVAITQIQLGMILTPATQ